MQETFQEINKAVKVQIYPNNEQKLLFNKNINHVRYIFNKVKQSCEYHYNIIQEQGIKPRNLVNRKFCNMILSQLKKSNNFLYDSDSTSLQAAYENYIQSMKNFFNHIAKYPKFKSKRSPIQSFKVKNVINSVRIENNQLKIAKHGFVKVRGLRNITGKIISTTITKIGNKWFASITYSKVIVKPLPKTNKSVGVDVGVKDLAILSTGEKDNQYSTVCNMKKE